jgi:hypothetical protein
MLSFPLDPHFRLRNSYTSKGRITKASYAHARNDIAVQTHDLL